MRGHYKLKQKREDTSLEKKIKVYFLCFFAISFNNVTEDFLFNALLSLGGARFLGVALVVVVVVFVLVVLVDVVVVVVILADLLLPEDASPSQGTGGEIGETNGRRGPLGETTS